MSFMNLICWLVCWLVRVRSGTRPHKHWVIGSLDMHRTQIFADPPWGGATEGVVRWRTPLPLQPISRITNASKNCVIRNRSLRSNTNERAL